MTQVLPNAEPRVEYDEESNNGMVFSNIIIPKEVISRIFTSYMDAQSLLNCQLVCKLWNMYITNYVWRKKATMSTLQHFTSKDPYDWKDYFIIYTKFGKNLVKNHSGAKKTKNWIILSNGGDKWATECPSLGAPHIPEEPEYENDQNCFVTSYGVCKKEQVIDLIQEGFSVNVLDNMQPTIEISEWYSCRWDCPATYNLNVHLTDLNEHTLDTYNFSDSLQHDRQNVWYKVEHTFKKYGKGLRRIHFTHFGRDNRFWAGHYGAKMARATIKVKVH